MKPSLALAAHREAIRRIVAAHRGLNPRVFGSVLRQEDGATNDLDLLNFLYQFDTLLKHDFGMFVRDYGPLYNQLPAWRWKDVSDNYPKLYQTAVSFILTGKLSDTVVSYRLEDLERIGLIDRSDVPAPKPKNVSITAEGIAVVEAAIEEAKAALRPSMEMLPRVAELRTKTVASSPSPSPPEAGDPDRGKPPAAQPS